MQISYSHDRLRRVAEDAAFLLLAMALSYVEAVLPLSSVALPPGVKLGLANLCILLAAGRSGIADAAAVALARVLLSAILFGGVSSMLFSLCGATLSLVALAIFRPLVGRGCSWIGVSVACAAAHNTGQILCACFWMHAGAVLSYLPVLWIAAVIFGGIVGGIANGIFARLDSRGRSAS